MESPADLLALLTMAMGVAVAWVFVGEIAGSRVSFLKRIFLPGAVLGGILGLLAGPQILALGEKLPVGTEGLARIYGVFGEFPGFFINVVFACLMLGKPLRGLRSIWLRSRRQVVMGHVFAWGQYVVGLSLVLFLLVPVFSVSPLVGPAIAIGFQGGHGTAAGLGNSFEELGFADGVTIAYAVATFGIVAGAVGGPVLATFLLKRHPIDKAQDGAPEAEKPGGGDKKSEEGDAPAEFSPLTGQLTLHLALIACIITTGWLILKGLRTLEASLRGVAGAESFVAYIPLFSVVLLVGFGVQAILQKFGWDRLFNRPIFDNISAFALDMVIFGALATLKLSVVGEYWIAILFLCLGGITWNLAVFFLLGPRIYPSPWYPYGLGDFGGGTATTASGLLLIRIADPEDQTEARQAYSGKQPFYEPFMGGGLVTAFALPIVASWGAGVSLVVTTSILAAWLLVAWRMMARGR